MENTTILQTLEHVQHGDTVPMHMPGHKRNSQLAPYLEKLSADLDITEIHNCDCLHHADGIIRNAMEKGRELWKSEYSYLLINGSTGGILAGIHGATRSGDTILMARGCHKAVYNAVALCGLQAEYFLQNQHPEGYYHPVTPEDVERGLENHPQCKLVVITSPTYEGYLSDIARISEICHKRNIPLMVDEAHGAHLGFTDYFTGSALRGGADIVIHSLHKTLPSLTQTAMAHVQGDLINPAQFANSLGIFETSSPSYLLMASIDGCLQLLLDCGAELFAHWQENLAEFYRQMQGLSHLVVVNEPSQVKDPGKIIISTARVNLDGTALKGRLRREFHIELEMAYGDYALAMTGMGDTADNLRRLAEALIAIDAQLFTISSEKSGYSLSKLPECVLSSHALHNHPVIPVKVEDAVGKICASYIWAYPPGVPMIVPGERIEDDLVELFRKLEENGVELQDTLHFWPEEIGIIDGLDT